MLQYQLVQNMPLPNRRGEWPNLYHKELEEEKYTELII